MYASLWGRLDVLKFLIRETGYNDYNNILLEGIKYIDLVKFAVENGANIHVNNDNVINSVISAGNLEVLKYLMQNGLSGVTENVFILSIKKNNAEIVRYLLSLKKFSFSINDLSDYLIISAKNGNVEVSKILLEAGANIDRIINDHVLYYNVTCGKMAFVKYLEELGMNITSNPYFLTFCLSNGHNDMAKYLIDKGNKIIFERDYNFGYNFINYDMVKYMVDNKVDIHVNRKGHFNECVYKGKLDIVKCLVSAGVKLDIDKRLIDDCIRKSNNEMVLYFIEMGVINSNNIEMHLSQIFIRCNILIFIRACILNPKYDLSSIINDGYTKIISYLLNKGIINNDMIHEIVNYNDVDKFRILTDSGLNISQYTDFAYNNHIYADKTGDLRIQKVYDRKKAFIVYLKENIREKAYEITMKPNGIRAKFFESHFGKNDSTGLEYQYMD